MSRLLRIALPTVVVAGVGLGVATSSADAAYFIGKREARAGAVEAAETKYASNGVNATGSSCRPQWETRARHGYIYHRWVCAWVGYDEDGGEVYGHFRITGHSDGVNGYMPLYGGLRRE